ncbi:uncharacterized protein [Macrobrachium rosenbergii]|uniref:uncharacterized protein isoform X2 n=1 Tax=Macrobrachium rosenbergii TaxID=79674 RepID=UPI0034D51954
MVKGIRLPEMNFSSSGRNAVLLLSVLAFMASASSSQEVEEPLLHPLAAEVSSSLSSSSFISRPAVTSLASERPFASKATSPLSDIASTSHSAVQRKRNPSLFTKQDGYTRTTPQTFSEKAKHLPVAHLLLGRGNVLPENGNSAKGKDSEASKNGPTVGEFQPFQNVVPSKTQNAHQSPHLDLRYTTLTSSLHLHPENNEDTPISNTEGEVIHEPLVPSVNRMHNLIFPHHSSTLSTPLLNVPKSKSNPSKVSETPTYKHSTEQTVTSEGKPEKYLFSHVDLDNQISIKEKFVSDIGNSENRKEFGDDSPYSTETISDSEQSVVVSDYSCEVVESAFNLFSDHSDKELKSLKESDESRKLSVKSGEYQEKGENSMRDINGRLESLFSVNSNTDGHFKGQPTHPPFWGPLKGGSNGTLCDVTISLTDSEGKEQEGDLDPSLPYKVNVLAGCGSVIALSVEDEWGIGLGRLEPSDQSEQITNCSHSVWVSSSPVLLAHWRVKPCQRPRRVIFRAVCLQGKSLTCFSTATFRVNTENIVRVKVKSPLGVVVVPASQTAHIEVPYAHRVTLRPLSDPHSLPGDRTISFIPTKTPFGPAGRRKRSVEYEGRGTEQEADDRRRHLIKKRVAEEVTDVRREGGGGGGEEEEKQNGSHGCSSSFVEITDSLSTWVACPLRQESLTSMSSVVGVRTDDDNSVGVEVESEGLSEASRTCGWGWVALESHCYLLEEQRVTWSAAEASCVSQGGHLAAITSPQVAHLLNSLTMASGESDPSAAFWVGASDSQYENSFTWSSGAPFSYSEWFPGWSDQGGYNSQPSDDGLGDEDCVELRRTFRLATKGSRTTHDLYWNDRSCSALNSYICEKPVPGGENESENWWCNRSLSLSPHAPPTVVTSPGYPAHYPPARMCVTTLNAPTNAHLVVHFDTFVLEPHPQCEYDSLMFNEPGLANSSSTVRCGDWTSKLKLLRYVSQTNRLILTFTSDYAHNFPGFRARVSARTGSGCGDGREVRRGDLCYLLVPYPQVTWTTATHICRDMEGELARVGSDEVVRWIGTGLKSLPDYASGALYWLGATLQPHTYKWQWQDGTLLNTTKVSGRVEGLQMPSAFKETLCLSLQEMSTVAPNRSRQSHQPPLSLAAHHCDMFGGYVCSRRVPEPPTAKSIVVTGYGGNLTTPGYPSQYPNNLHLTITLRGPASSRLVITFTKIDLEYQQDCLYDYVGLQSGPQDSMTRYCGRHLKDMERFDYVSKSNEAVVTFHSDWSVVGAGVMGRWRVVDISSCPHQELRQSQGIITSPNFPYFNLDSIHCTTTIKASVNERIWLQFQTFEVGAKEPIPKDDKKSASAPSSLSPETDVGDQPGPIAQKVFATPHPFISTSSSTSASLPPSANFTHHSRRFTRAISTSIDTSQPQNSNSIINGKNSANQKCQDDYVEVTLGEGVGESLRLCGAVSRGEVQRLSYVSYSSTLTIVLHTTHRGGGGGFQATYLIGTKFNQRTVLQLGTQKISREDVGVPGEENAVSLGSVHALNFPLAPAPGVILTHQLLAPPGHQLHLRIHNIGVLATPERPCQQDYVEVEDWYAGKNGTVWTICSVDRSSRHEISIRSIFNSLTLREVHLAPRESLKSEEDNVVKKDKLQGPTSSSSSSSSSSPPLSSSSSPSSSSPALSSSVAMHTSSSHAPSFSAFRGLEAPQSFFSGELKSASQRFISYSILDALSSSSDTMKLGTTQKPDTASEFPTTDTTELGTTTYSKISPNAIISPPFDSWSENEHHRLSPVSASSSSSSSSSAPLMPSNSLPTKNYWASSVAYFSASYEVHKDPGWLNRSIGLGLESMGIRTTGVAWCEPSPCLNNGRCITQDGNHTCLCTPGYTGAFCQMTWCDMAPCVWGRCQPGGPDGFVCVCEKGYGGPHCMDRISPCDGDPCQSRGVCKPVNHTFHCQCHAWWEGVTCERRMRRIPFKPLSERMFEEPFWLGLMTVGVVMACIGVAFCIKKHFADKIEKFFAEEIERSKYGGSAASSSGSPRRTQHKCRSQTASPRVDSKKILRHLVTPPVGHRASSFDELLHLHTQTPKCSVERTRSTDIATELRRSDGGDGSTAIIEGLIHETSLTSLAPSPSKQDKKVTFAKLLDKMSKEISSSSSDISCAEDKSPSRIFNMGGSRRSPRRSPRIRHTQRYSGSGSEDIAETPDVSSSEMTPDPPKRLLTIKSSSSPSSKTSSPQSRNKMVKISSADSLLAMFRNFGGSGRASASNPSSPHGSELEDSSAHQSPSTTPTTPQKAPPPVKQDTLTVPGALQVQVQSSGGGSVQHGGPVITLEVPTNDQYRCLSPITELPTPVPTPVPSPLPTPCRQRPKPRTSSESNDNKESEDTESEFSLSMSVERSSSDSSGPDHRIFFTSLKSLNAVHDASSRSETLSPTGVTITPSSSLSSRTPSPVTSPTASPAASPKVKTKPPPLHIPNANVLKFSPDKGEGSSIEGACSGGICLQVPVIKVEDAEEDVRWDSAPRTRSQSVDVGSIMQAPLITISPADDDPPTPPAHPPPLVIPTLNVTLASPPVLRKTYPPVPTITIEEPDSKKPPIPPRRNPPLKREKASSLDLQQAPSITVTSMLSEVESDTDSPTTGCRQGGPASSYLSPFLGVELRASESNLSSSGYSSAYSPGPSRCSSDNPLCLDEPLTPSVSSIPARHMNFPNPAPPVIVPPRNKRRPVFKTPSTEIVTTAMVTPPILRTDSETTDDPGTSQPEADSALELDTNDECSDGVLQVEKTNKLSSEEEAEAQRQRLLLSSSHSFPKESPRLVRSPPAIVVHSSLPSESSLEDCLSEKPSRLSPVSSRSESPISDSRLSVARIYPAFFGVSGKPELPYTDSDGLYDCPSSEVLHSDSHVSVSPLKRLGKKKLKRSPGKGLKSLLGFNDVGSADTGSGTGALSDGAKSRLEPPNWERSPRRHSPKRRVRAQTSVDLLSSSNESITSQSPAGSSSSPGENGGVQTDTEASRDGSGIVAGQRLRRRRPLLRGNSIQTNKYHLPRQGSIDASGEETQEEQLMLKPSRGTAEELPRHRKISRFRNFGNQIRFLRRLQLSKVPKDHLVSPTGSSDSDPECGPPEGPSRAGPSAKRSSGSSSSNKGSSSHAALRGDPRYQVKYKPVNGGCGTTVRSFSS